MAKKGVQINIDEFLGNNLQAKVRNYVGTKQIEKVEMPSSFATSLNPRMRLRPYQVEAFQYFISYWENDFEDKPPYHHLLFHMATGSGKTLIMAGIILYLYEKGYRNFFFFVDNDNVIEKTKDNFFNLASSKYLFGQSITINNKRVEIKQVDNFQDSDPNAINFCLQTTQKMHSDLNSPKESRITYDDFKDIKVVLIADEAHHINSKTKKSNPGQYNLYTEKELEDMEPSTDWETTAARIFCANPANVWLEFTATQDFANANIADKYKDKVIFDYPLKKFREDKYSKDIALLQSDMPPIERAIQAVIMSQFRRKLGNQIRQHIKPVVMLKSKTITANKEFFGEFVETIKHLTVDTLNRIKANAKDGVLDAFNYFDTQGITLENLLLEIQDDFKEDNLLLVDGSSNKHISAKNQQFLNSLEDRDNEFRAVFAVDMLNEGWDVLNLFDIVRLYNTRGGNAKDGQVKDTTNSEAQLIGRGARYWPFTYKPESQQYISATDSINKDSSGGSSPALAHAAPQPHSEYASKRKFEDDLNNPLRYLETLSYHSAHNPRYIQELTTVLEHTGLIDSKSTIVVEKLKESFKKSRLYEHGYVFVNSRKEHHVNENLTNIGKNILDEKYEVRINTGATITSRVFSKAYASDSSNLYSRRFKLKDFGKHILRAAINKFDSFTFQELHKIFPNLESTKQFIESSDYLANISVTVYGREETIDKLSQKNKLFVAIEVLREISPKLARDGIVAEGTKEFMPKPIKKVFKDHIYKVSKGENKEEGVSMKETPNPLLRFDLSIEKWYGYEDNFGTEEEKYLIRYIESLLPKLREKYCEVYLLRNYKDFQIYDFRDGRATEPDFVLFLRQKGTDTQFDNIQIFIEPKGKHLRREDRWKEEFEMAIHDEAMVNFKTKNDRFEMWGMPFYTKNYENIFDKAFSKSF